MIKILLVALIFCFVLPTSASDCDECTFIASTIKTLVQNNQTLVQIKTVILQYCNLLSSPYNTQCQSLVNAHLNQVVQLIVKYDNPKTVCSFIGFCSTKQAVKLGSGPECTICTYLVGIAEKWLESNATENRILGVFETACSILPSSGLKSVCRAMIDQYGRELIQLLVNKENPDAVCQLLKVCPTSAKKATSLTNVKANPIPCYLCQYVVKNLEAFITANSTEAEILAFAEKLCTVLPSSLQKVCKSLVDVYIPQVLQELVNKENPQTVCSGINLCSTRAAMEHLQAAFAARKKFRADPQNCQVCQFLVLTLEGYITANTTEQDVLKYANLFCDTLGPLSNGCRALVAQDLPQVIQYLVNKASPLVICTKLKVCASKTGVILRN